ncbi:hypothetical protein EDF39_1416 [Frondihabitans sp. PhB161]|nr:hypothetical protein EDF37_1414 [Frondihabitans sp. PhB153]RPF09014.1 hypothetical protein EDF39_1416 [Frondihabitans sp. PhB161]
MALGVAVLLYLAVPETFPVYHRLPIAGLLVVGTLSVAIMHWKQIERPVRWSGIVAQIVAAMLVSANVGGGVDVMIGFGEPGSLGLVRLLIAAAQVGVTQILAFALVFWLVDRGGPSARRHRPIEQLATADFDFTGPGRYSDPTWAPSFGDYLVLSLRTAFAVTASGPRSLTLRARILTGVEAFTGFALLGVVIVKTVVRLVA